MSLQQECACLNRLRCRQMGRLKEDVQSWGGHSVTHVVVSHLQKHDPPLSSIPCLHYKKMKDSEEREQNRELAPGGEVSPAKPPGRSAELELPMEEPDSLGADSGPPDEKDTLGAEAAPGALGQVKAKVEVCKDESVGESPE